MKTSTQPLLVQTALILPATFVAALLAKQCSAPAEMATPPTTQTRTHKPLCARTIPDSLVEESWQRPAYILQGDRALVDVPGLGYVEGKAYLNYEFEELDELTKKPRRAEIVVTDDEGNFFYMRGRPFTYQSKRDINAYLSELRRHHSLVRRREPDPRSFFKDIEILGPCSKKLTDPEFARSLTGYANLDEPFDSNSREYECWGLCYRARWTERDEPGEKDVVSEALLVGRGGGDVVPNPWGTIGFGDVRPSGHHRGYTASELTPTRNWMRDLLVREDWLVVPDQLTEALELEKRKAAANKQDLQNQ